MYTCCSQRGSLGIHTVEGCTREGCVLIYALLSAVVRRALGVSAYTGLLEQSLGHSGSDTVATLHRSFLRCEAQPWAPW